MIRKIGSKCDQECEESNHGLDRVRVPCHTRQTIVLDRKIKTIDSHNQYHR